MVNRRSILENVNNSVKSTGIIGDGRKISLARCGSVFISSNGKEPQKGIALTNVLYVPKLDINLIYCNALSRDGYSTTFRNGYCTITMDCKTMCNVKVQNQRFSHKDKKAIKQMESLKTVSGIDTNKRIHINTCQDCEAGK